MKKTKSKGPVLCTLCRIYFMLRKKAEMIRFLFRKNLFYPKESVMAMHRGNCVIDKFLSNLT